MKPFICYRRGSWRVFIGESVNWACDSLIESVEFAAALYSGRVGRFYLDAGDMGTFRAGHLILKKP